MSSTSYQRHRASTVPPLVVGCDYDLASGSEFATVTVTGEANAVDGMVPVVCNGREMRIDLQRYTVSKHRNGRGRSTKTPTDNLFLYICSIDRNMNFKIGVTARPNKRIKEIRTYASNAKMLSVVRIPHQKSKDWRKIEKEVIQKFQIDAGGVGSKRRGTEVLSLTPDGLCACRQYMRSLCSRA